ncbi:substrate binding domain-containing protein [Alishewanella sp. HL-SH06]|uniref:substrate binding domain-containing protein n=1 Tax=Alishewanella sp. HL-SH06 TaxID=3461144 RepID=UPI0040421D4D
MAGLGRNQWPDDTEMGGRLMPKSLAGSSRNTQSLIAKKIAPIKLVLCAAPSYIEKYGNPSQPDELNSSHFLHYSYTDYASSNHPLMRVLRANSQNNQVGLTANNGQILTAAATAGEGYILQPTFIVGEALKQGKLKTMLNDIEVDAMSLYAVYPHRKLLAPKLRVFLDFMSSYFGAPLIGMFID